MTNVSAELNRPVWIEVERLQMMSYQILESHGFSSETSRIIADELIINEHLTLRSHGLLRLAEYIIAVQAGNILVEAKPEISKLSENVAILDGNRAAGAVVAHLAAKEINSMLANHQLAALTIRASGHLGRLGSIGQAICKAGNCVVGAFNYLGHGKRVAPSGTFQPLIGTNPIMAAFPGIVDDQIGCAFLLDMSTSVVSEGKIRNAVRSGRKLPRGWLGRTDGRHCCDGRELYTSPPSALLLPLGGVSCGHKGLGLGVAVELLAGVISGAGSIESPAAHPGNGGVLIGFRPDLFGLGSVEVLAKLQATVTKLAEEISLSSPKQRLAGTRSISAAKLPKVINIERSTYREFQALYNQRIQRLSENLGMVAS